jgi:hypothetical protein
MAKVHIGKKIREVLERSEYTVVDFAKLINRSRDVVYKIFEKETINTGQLSKIGEVLKHDFFQYLSRDMNAVHEPYQHYGPVSRAEFTELFKTVERLAQIVERDHTLKRTGKSAPYRKSKKK